LCLVPFIAIIWYLPKATKYEAIAFRNPKSNGIPK
jgi:hypothetical protein